MKKTIIALIVAIVFSLQVQTASAGTCSLKFAPHKEGALVNFVVNSGPSETGPWATFATVPGTDTTPGKTMIVPDGTTCCMRVKAVRISDSRDSTWVQVCGITPKDPEAAQTVELTVK